MLSDKLPKPLSEMKVAVFTIVAKNYLAHARTLMESVKQHHPEFARFVLLTDQPDGYVDPAQEDFELELSIDLPIPKNSLFHFKYTILELATAVKPYYLQQLLVKHNFDAVLYIDPDIMFFDRVDPILEALTTSNVVLTPHLLGPLNDTKKPSEVDILLSGSYNLGFIGVSNTPTTHNFLKWWQDRLYNDCISNVTEGYFVDQRWIDLVPGMYEGVTILHNPGLNAAYWNLAQIEITKVNDRYYANNQPLRFYHFSGYNPEKSEQLSKYQTRFQLVEMGEVFGLTQVYAQALFRHGYTKCKKWPYSFGRFSSGDAIPEFARRLIRDDLQAQEQLPGAYTPETDQFIIDYFNENNFPGYEIVISRLLAYLYKLRGDLREYFPNIPGSDNFRLVHWFLRNASVEYGISDVLLDPMRESLLHYIEPQVIVDKRKDGPTALVDQFLFDWLNSPAQNIKKNPHVSLVAFHFYNIDPQAHSSIADPLESGRAALVDWFVNEAAVKYNLPDFLVEPVKNPTRQMPLSSNIVGLLGQSEGGKLILEWMQSFVGVASKDAPYPRLTQFAYHLGQASQDAAVKADLDAAMAGQWRNYYQWFLNTAVSTYKLPDTLVEPVRTQFELANFYEGLNKFDRLLLRMFNTLLTEHAPHISIAAYRLHQLRSDLQGAFGSDVLGQNRTNYAYWYAAEGGALLHPALTISVRLSLGQEMPKIAEWPASIQATLQKAHLGQLLLSWLNQDFKPELTLPARITRLAYFIWEQDEELRAKYPDPFGQDNQAFAKWFVTKAASIYELPASFVRPVAQSLGIKTEAAAEAPIVIRRAPNILLRPFSQRRQRPAPPAGPVSDYFKQLEPPARHFADSSEDGDREYGLNVVGYLNAPTGVGEAARRTIQAAQARHIPLTTHSLAVDAQQEQTETRKGAVNPYNVNLFHVNADQFPETLRSIGKNFLHNKYNIGYWYWELGEFPAAYWESFNWLKEVWVATSFVQEALSLVAPVPVVKIPPAINPIVAPNYGREAFRLPKDRFLFLTMFDIASVYERKNPEAVIQAFSQAFAGNFGQVGLVLKVSGVQRDPAKLEALRAQTAHLPVYIVDSFLKQEEVNALTACCDCTISLHRSEGFGLTLAEAMWLGKPVIATAYSGNMDFTRFNNSFLVNYELVKLQKDYSVYPKGSHWAEPDLEHAIYQMRQVVEERARAAEVARQGQTFIRQHYSLEAVGQQIAKRLEFILRLDPGQKTAQAAGQSVRS